MAISRKLLTPADAVILSTRSDPTVRLLPLFGLPTCRAAAVVVKTARGSGVGEGV